ncbi:hypothetical protein [Flexithrix dorotheae]|uniref:hypothetical protein n=1 Tax=Flexithrix dorotheae TaxID=70993 RepID=UPI0012F7BB1E|nr:hypothetical protein [Flexithrix dorotheae]
MKTSITFLVFLIILIFCSKQNETNAQQPKLILIEELKGEITKDGAGEIKIGNSMSETVKRLDKFVVKKNAFNGFDVFEEGKLAISFWVKNQEDTIGFIKIFSEKYKTKKGLKVGISLNELKQLRNDFLLNFDEMDYREYFAPPEL